MLSLPLVVFALTKFALIWAGCTYYGKYCCISSQIRQISCTPPPQMDYFPQDIPPIRRSSHVRSAFLASNCPIRFNESGLEEYFPNLVYIKFDRNRCLDQCTDPPKVRTRFKTFEWKTHQPSLFQVKQRINIWGICINEPTATPLISTRAQPTTAITTRAQSTTPLTIRTRPTPPLTTRREPTTVLTTRTQPSTALTTRAQPTWTWPTLWTWPTPPLTTRTLPTHPLTTRRQPTTALTTRAQPSTAPTTTRAQPTWTWPTLWMWPTAPLTTRTLPTRPFTTRRQSTHPHHHSPPQRGLQFQSPPGLNLHLQSPRDRLQLWSPRGRLQLWSPPGCNLQFQSPPVGNHQPHLWAGPCQWQIVPAQWNHR